MAVKPRLLHLGMLNAPHVEAMALEMRKRGHEVCVAGHVSKRWSSVPDSFEREGVTVIATREKAPHLDKRIGEHVDWVREVARRARPDVIHAHILHTYPFVASLEDWRATLIGHSWGSDVFRNSPENLAAVRYSLQRLDVVGANSQALRERVIQLGADAERVRAIPWGVELDRFSPVDDKGALRNRLGLPAGRMIFAPRGDQPHYNLPVVLRAFAELADEQPDIQLVAKGEPNGLEPELLRHRERLHFFDHVDNQQMADYYRAADACVSVPASDGLPGSVLEALASGTPCVISDLPWVQGMIEPDGEALVVPANAQAVTGALRRILTDDGLAESLRNRGRKLVESGHDRDKHMDELSELYDRVAPAPEPPRRLRRFLGSLRPRRRPRIS